MNIFVIRPFEPDDSERNQAFMEYADLLRKEEDVVDCPELTVESGIEVFEDVRQRITDAEAIHVFYDARSPVVHLLMGMAFALKKPLVVIADASDEHFSEMLREWQESTKTRLMTKQELVRYYAERKRKRIVAKEVVHEQGTVNTEEEISHE